MTRTAPDLILAPALLSPADEAELLSHMKGLVTCALHSDADRAGARYAGRRAGRTGAPARPLPPRVQPSARVSWSAVRQPDGGGADCRRSRTLPASCGSNTPRCWHTTRRWESATGKPRWSWRDPAAAISGGCERRRSPAGEQTGESADERRVALRQGTWLGALVVGHQALLGARAAAGQHLQHRRAGRERIQVHARQHDRSVPDRSGDKPRRCRCVSFAATSPGSTGSVSATTPPPPSPKSWT